MTESPNIEAIIVEVSKFVIHPGEILVIKFPADMPQNEKGWAITRFRNWCKARGVDWLILDLGMELQVIQKERS